MIEIVCHTLGTTFTVPIMTMPEPIDQGEGWIALDQECDTLQREDTSTDHVYYWRVKIG